MSKEERGREGERGGEREEEGERERPMKLEKKDKIYLPKQINTCTPIQCILIYPHSTA